VATVFTEAERSYLIAHPLGRLATIGPAGSPKMHPVALELGDDAATIRIGGPDLTRSQTYRNTNDIRGSASMWRASVPS
jgi:pyridoxamine 5'-phosphate oxidase family protein